MTSEYQKTDIEYLSEILTIPDGFARTIDGVNIMRRAFGEVQTPKEYSIIDEKTDRYYTANEIITYLRKLS